MSEIKEDILAGNKLIAEFMGAKITSPVGYTGRDVVFSEVTHGLRTHVSMALRYHLNWDWLMPVVEKIESLGYRVLIERGGGITNYCKIRKRKDMIAESASHNSKINATFSAVIEFITWYNNNLNK